MIRSGRSDDGRTTLRIAATGELLSESLELTAGAGLRRLIVRHERLPPRRRASSPHAHSHKEEVVYVLRGRPTLSVGDRRFGLAPDDCVSLPPGEVVHVLENETDEPVELLVVSSESDDDVVAYDER